MPKFTEFYEELQGRPGSKVALDMESRASPTTYAKLSSLLDILKNLDAHKEEQEELHFFISQIIKAILTNIGGGIDWDDVDLWDIDWEEIDSLEHKTRHQRGGVDEISLTGLEGTEIRLVPKASSSGAEGTMYYDSDDDSVYVATEA